MRLMINILFILCIIFLLISMRSKYLDEGRSESSDHYLVALSRDIFEKHTVYHSKELPFSYYLAHPRCTITFNSNIILYIAPKQWLRLLLLICVKSVL